MENIPTSNDSWLASLAENNRAVRELAVRQFLCFLLEGLNGNKDTFGINDLRDVAYRRFGVPFAFACEFVIYTDESNKPHVACVVEHDDNHSCYTLQLADSGEIINNVAADRIYQCKYCQDVEPLLSQKAADSEHKDSEQKIKIKIKHQTEVNKMFYEEIEAVAKNIVYADIRESDFVDVCTVEAFKSLVSGRTVFCEVKEVPPIMFVYEFVAPHFPDDVRSDFIDGFCEDVVADDKELAECIASSRRYTYLTVYDGLKVRFSRIAVGRDGIELTEKLPGRFEQYVKAARERISERVYRMLQERMRIIEDSAAEYAAAETKTAKNEIVDRAHYRINQLYEIADLDGGITKLETKMAILDVLNDTDQTDQSTD